MSIDPEIYSQLQIFSDRLDKSVVALTSRLDAMPSRREIDILNENLVSIRSEFDKFVLRTEFNLINASNTEMFKTIVPRSEIEARWRDTERRFAIIDVKTENIGHFPAWLTSLVVGVALNVAAAIAEHFIK